MRIDFKEDSLASRMAANLCLSRVLEQVGDHNGLIVLDFGEKIATASWIDGFLVNLLKHIASGQLSNRVLVVSSSEDTREHISLVLDKRALAVFAVSKIDDLIEGSLEVLGHISVGGNETIATIQRLGEAAVSDIAAGLGTSIEAAQLRLTALLDVGLIQRIRTGRAYIYTLPVMQAVENILVPA